MDGSLDGRAEACNRSFIIYIKTVNLKIKEKGFRR